ncbi:hypothetical protein [Bacillus paranthracis]|uniref:hypothetical protein n=1 Tax=Bacillus paranthracis TaxID=2026186 RepID=UPI002E1BF6A7|nr:hypothetical protein [Bacillus paranthracis]MED1679895.1 hypothetical protein [Bacillus paranthracis]
MGNDKVLDQTYYDMSKLAYSDSAEIPDEVKIRDEQKNVLQTWHVSNEIDNSLLHDKKTGFDAVVFERDLETTESKRLEHTIMNIRSDLESTSRWYVSNAKEIGDFIEKKAKEYRTTDESY